MGSGADLQDDTVFSELPSILKTAVAYELTEKLLQQSNIFGALKPEARRVVASRLTPVSLPAGHDLCVEGDEADCLWILQHGARPPCAVLPHLQGSETCGADGSAGGPCFSSRDACHRNDIHMRIG